MTALETIQRELKPQLQRLSQYLDSTQSCNAAAFFRNMHDDLAKAVDEEQLLDVFLALSTTAFQDFMLDPFAAQVADRVLMRAQHYAHTLSADDERKH